MLGKIAGIDAHPLDADAVNGQPRRQLHHLAGGGLGVPGIDQQHHVVGLGMGEMFERQGFVVVRLDEGMRHGAEHRDAELLPGQHVRGPGESRDVGRACRQQAGLGTVGAAQAEVHQQLVRCHQHRARGLGSDQGLQVQ